MKKLLILFIRLLLTLLFGYAATAKLADHHQFANILSKSYYAPDYADIISWALPITELLVSLLLLIKYTQFYGLYASVILMVIFTSYIGLAPSFELHKMCSCGGILNRLNWTVHFYFNIGFTIIAISGLLLEKSRRIQKKLPKEKFVNIYLPQY